VLFSFGRITPPLIAPISRSRRNTDDLADYFLDRRRKHPLSNSFLDGVPCSLACSFSRRKHLIADF
jgi:hypothetical protein